MYYFFLNNEGISTLLLFFLYLSEFKVPDFQFSLYTY